MENMPKFVIEREIPAASPRDPLALVCDR